VSAPFEITVFSKDGGPLTKQISLAADGSIKCDGSACVMTKGSARRFPFTTMSQYSELLIALKFNDAIVGGALLPGLPDEVKVVTKRKLNGAEGVIARTKDFIDYRPGQPALAPIDFDLKDMPPATAAALDALGGLWPALVSVYPSLASVGRVQRASTSAGLFHAFTGEPFNSSGGQHIYVPVVDGSDIERFLKALHQRCWLSGLGWMIVGAAGQLLERSIVDRVCGTPERFMFEGPPVLIEPIAQDLAVRQPIIVEGEALDTRKACPPLTVVELATLHELRAKEAYRLEGDRAKARERFIDRKSHQLAERTRMNLRRARRTIERQCEGVLLPDVVLPFDDPELEGKTVAHVLANPADFEGETLADPIEGPEYGGAKAKVMLRPDGSVWIHSFAHGGASYELRQDFAAVKAVLAKRAKEDIADGFVQFVLAADLTDAEVEQLKQIAANRSGVGVRALAATLKQARGQQKARKAQQERDRRIAERRDLRSQILAPAKDAPWNPQMDVLNEVLGRVDDLEPPMRDVDGVIVVVRVRRMPKLHAFTALGANQGESEEMRLPAPEQPLLTRLTEPQLAELIERYIDYVDNTDRSVHLHGTFVHHFHTRPDDVALPLASAVVTLPLVLGDGTLLKGRGLDRDRGIVFRIPEELGKILPDKADCTPSAVAEAMRLLTDEWLCDVATDYTGKCTIIAGALSVIERSILPDRPIFWVTAGRRGGGKTTTLIMLLVAVTGIRPAAAAWSPNEEERRKALLAYLLEGMPALIWDNIPNGQKISCPHIERSCTTTWYSDRRLGVSETVATSAATIHFFTGNNVGPRSDLTSRSLQTRIVVDRPDPENRTFDHPDPIGWTESNRGKILRALYTVLLGNPLFHGKRKPAQTRFKTWWSVVGQAVEAAAEEHKKLIEKREIEPLKCPPTQISFKKLFLAQEDEDEDSLDSADALTVLAEKWRDQEAFQAADVAAAINTTGEWATEIARERGAVLRDFLFPKVPQSQAVTAKSTGKRLKRHLDEPVARNGKVLVLKARTDPHTKLLVFYVHVNESPT
jgi:hypothetical protein